MLKWFRTILKSRQTLPVGLHDIRDGKFWYMAQSSITDLIINDLHVLYTMKLISYVCFLTWRKVFHLHCIGISSQFNLLMVIWSFKLYKIFFLLNFRGKLSRYYYSLIIQPVLLRKSHQRRSITMHI